MTELADIAQSTGVPKPSLLRLISVLIDEGYVERAARGRYRLTTKLWRLGTLIVHPLDLRQNVRPVLQHLVNVTGETAHYSVYEDGCTVYLDKVDGIHPLRWYTRIGSTGPAYAAATGKVLLASRDEAEVRRVAEGSERLTDATAMGFEAIRREMAKVRRRGYAVNRGEWRGEVWGVAAPVRDTAGETVAAVGISGPRDRISARLDEFIGETKKAAVTLSTPTVAEAYGSATRTRAQEEWERHA